MRDDRKFRYSKPVPGALDVPARILKVEPFKQSLERGQGQVVAMQADSILKER